MHINIFFFLYLLFAVSLFLFLFVYYFFGWDSVFFMVIFSCHAYKYFWEVGIFHIQYIFLLSRTWKNIIFQGRKVCVGVGEQMCVDVDGWLSECVGGWMNG